MSDRAVSNSVVGVVESDLSLAPPGGSSGAAEFERIGIDVYEDRLVVHWPGGSVVTVARDDEQSGDAYMILCDALDSASAYGCAFHDGASRDPLACDCGPDALESVPEPIRDPAVVSLARDLFDEAIADQPPGRGWDEVEQWVRDMWVDAAHKAKPGDRSGRPA